MTDHTPPEKPKTLTLTKKKPIDQAKPKSNSVKTGARAHAVARLRVERDKIAKPDASEPRRDRPIKQAKSPVVASLVAPAVLPAATAPKPSSRGAPSKNQRIQTYEIFTPCPSGLEGALEHELNALGLSHVKRGRAGCHAQVDWAGVLRVNLMSRIATRVLARVGYGLIEHEDDLYDLVKQIEWERLFGAERTLRVDTSAIKSPMQSLQFCNLVAKDAICDHLLEVEGERPSIDTVRPDARVHVFLDQTSATIYLDTSGESLFKRGWRFDKGEAPIRENLAAGLLALSGWQPHMPLFDPFCGSGTIAIEAAWISLNIPPGFNRPFAFERLRNHDSRLWQNMLDTACSQINPHLQAPIIAMDIDPQAIESAKRNAERSGLDPTCIDFRVGDAVQTPPDSEPGMIVTNPPYGDRLDTYDLTLWKEWAQQLKHSFAGWQLHVISSERDLPQYLRLKPRLKTPVFNGALDCRLFAFDMVAASYRDKKA